MLNIWRLRFVKFVSFVFLSFCCSHCAFLNDVNNGQKCNNDHQKYNNLQTSVIIICDTKVKGEKVKGIGFISQLSEATVSQSELHHAFDSTHAENKEAVYPAYKSLCDTQ